MVSTAAPTGPGCNVAAVVRRAVAHLERASETPRLDAEILLAHACGITRAKVLAHPEVELTSRQRASFDAAIARRATGEPLAYITGVREFHALELAVSRQVLVPRPETELLVETALALLEGRHARVVDLGTGSGAIALALKESRPDLDLTAVDRDRAALEVARTNASALGLDVQLVLSNWFQSLAGRRFDLVVCNPPYVPSADAHFAGTLRHEPRPALDGGPDGLDAYRAVLDHAGDHLADGGSIVFEHGYDQRQALATLARERRFRVAGMHEDLAGHPRVLVLEPSAGPSGRATAPDGAAARRGHRPDCTSGPAGDATGTVR